MPGNGEDLVDNVLDRCGGVSDHAFLRHPEVVLMPTAVRRFPRYRIALVSQLAVAMDGVMSTALQSIANGGLAVPERPSIR